MRRVSCACKGLENFKGNPKANQESPKPDRPKPVPVNDICKGTLTRKEPWKSRLPPNPKA